MRETKRDRAVHHKSCFVAQSRFLRDTSSYYCIQFLLSTTSATIYKLLAQRKDVFPRDKEKFLVQFPKVLCPPCPPVQFPQFSLLKRITIFSLLLLVYFICLKTRINFSSQNQVKKILISRIGHKTSRILGNGGVAQMCVLCF